MSPSLSLCANGMSSKRSFLPRRIIHSAFSVTKSRKQSNYRDLNGIIPDHINLGGDGGRKENGGDDDRCCDSERGQRWRQQIAVVSSGKLGPDESDRWAGMLPELLGEIMQRVEATEEQSPQRQNVVACACVCRQWRQAAKEAAEKASIDHPGIITFPPSLKKVQFSGFCIDSIENSNHVRIVSVSTAYFYYFRQSFNCMLESVSLSNLDFNRNSECMIQMELSNRNSLIFLNVAAAFVCFVCLTPLTIYSYGEHVKIIGDAR